MELNGKSAIVTGASSGIGAATAIKLAREGVKVGLAARRRDRLQALVSEIKAFGGEAIAHFRHRQSQTGGVASYG